MLPGSQRPSWLHQPDQQLDGGAGGLWAPPAKSDSQRQSTGSPGSPGGPSGDWNIAASRGAPEAGSEAGSGAAADWAAAEAGVGAPPQPWQPADPPLPQAVADLNSQLAQQQEMLEAAAQRAAAAEERGAQLERLVLHLSRWGGALDPRSSCSACLPHAYMLFCSWERPRSAG